MTMEPVWAGGFAVTLGSEPVGVRLLIGGALALAAMFLAELGPRAGLPRLPSGRRLRSRPRSERVPPEDHVPAAGGSTSSA
jgi:drug/metabolite transporter (DMT)-like permease